MCRATVNTTLFFNYSSAGIHTFRFVAYDNETNDSVTKHVNVTNMPLIITVNNPTAGTYNSRSIPIDVHTSNPVDTCIYSLNDSAEILLTGSNQNFYQTIDAQQDGKYTLLVNCSNTYDSAMVSLTFTIDTVNPVILSKSYTINEHNDVTINAATDVPCNCKYDIIL